MTEGTCHDPAALESSIRRIRNLADTDGGSQNPIQAAPAASRMQGQAERRAAELDAAMLWFPNVFLELVRQLPHCTDDYYHGLIALNATKQAI